MKLNIVPARTGIQWVKLGLKTFLKQPLALAGLFFMYFLTITLVGAGLNALGAPALVGIFVTGIIAPAATLGMMAAAKEASEGRFPMPTVLVSAFRAGPGRTRAMLGLGVAYAALFMLVFLLMGGASPLASLAPAAPAMCQRVAVPPASMPRPAVMTRTQPPQRSGA